MAMPLVKPLGVVGIILSCALAGCNPLEERRHAGPGRQQRRHPRTQALQPRRLQDAPLLLQPQGSQYPRRPPAQQQGEGGEGEPGDESRLLGGAEVVVGTAAAWSKLVTAGLPAQRGRCLSPPCVEVHMRGHSCGTYRMKRYFCRYKQCKSLVYDTAMSCLLCRSCWRCHHAKRVGGFGPTSTSTLFASVLVRAYPCLCLCRRGDTYTRSGLTLEKRCRASRELS